MNPRVLRVERVFPNSFLRGLDYTWFEKLFDALVEEMKMRICGCFVDKQATFVMNRELYKLFYSVAPMRNPYIWDGIYIKEDLTPEYLPWNKNEERKGRILLEYREPKYIPFELSDVTVKKEEHKNFVTWFPPEPGVLKLERKPEIKKVIFNNPATIVFWEDGTKTIVKAQEGDGWDMEKGLAMAIVKRTHGLKEFYKHYNKAVDKYWEENNE